MLREGKFFQESPFKKERWSRHPYLQGYDGISLLVLCFVNDAVCSFTDMTVLFNLLIAIHCERCFWIPWDGFSRIAFDRELSVWFEWSCSCEMKDSHAFWRHQFFCRLNYCSNIFEIVLPEYVRNIPYVFSVYPYCTPYPLSNIFYLNWVRSTYVNKNRHKYTTDTKHITPLVIMFQEHISLFDKKQNFIAKHHI